MTLKRAGRGTRRDLVTRTSPCRTPRTTKPSSSAWPRVWAVRTPSFGVVDPEEMENGDKRSAFRPRLPSWLAGALVCASEVLIHELFKDFRLSPRLRPTLSTARSPYGTSINYRLAMPCGTTCSSPDASW